MKIDPSKIAPWVPLIIAAGYFVFLIGTWQKFTINLKAADERFNQMVAKLEKGNDSGSVGDNPAV